MRAAVLIVLLLASACHRADVPHTMIYGNVVDFQRHPVKQFASKQTCTIAQGLIFEKPQGLTQYYACEPTNSVK